MLQAYLSDAFLKEIEEQLSLKRRVMLQTIQQQVRMELGAETKYVLFFHEQDETVTIEHFKCLSELWDAHYAEESFQNHSMVYDEYEEIIRSVVIQEFQTALDKQSLEDVQTIFSERGYEEISSLKAASEELYSCFDDEICELVIHYLDEFGSVPIEALLHDGNEQTKQWKQYYNSLLYDASILEHVHLKLAFMLEQREQLLHMMEQDVVKGKATTQLAPTYVNYCLKLLLSPLILEDLLQLLKLENVPLDDFLMLDEKTVQSILPRTAFYKALSANLEAAINTLLHQQLPALLQLKKQDWFQQAEEFHQFITKHPSPVPFTNLHPFLFSAKKGHPYYYKQFKKERPEMFSQILSYIQDAHINQLNNNYETNITLPSYRLKDWFTDITHTEIVFLQSKQFAAHLQKTAIYMFGDDLAQLYISKQGTARQFTLHIGPTNAGKTHAALLDLQAAKSGVYLAPLRLLALEKFEELNERGVLCSLQTGEEYRKVSHAAHVSATVEAVDLHTYFEVAVIDECQMIGDFQRGAAWTKALLGVQARHVHLIAAPHAEALLRGILEKYHFPYEVVYHARTTPLQLENGSFHFPKHVHPGDAFIVFSKRKVLSVAAQLLNKGYKVSILYGSMPPETRRLQMQQYREGKTTVLVATDAIGMGLNLPIQRIIFLEAEKFDGKSVRLLTASEVQQIAGRAGRRGVYERGLVNATKNRKYIAKSLQKGILSLEKAILPFPLEKIDIFPYQSFDLLLAVWNIYQEHYKHGPFRLTETTQLAFLYKQLLPVLKKLQINLPLSKIISYCSLPFSIHDTTLVSYWLQLITKHEQGESISLPTLSETRSIDVLEKQYEQLSLYAAFMRGLLLPFDEQYVLEKKLQISTSIFYELSKNLKKFSRTCSSCNRILPWDFPHGRCDRCYRQYYDDEWY